MELKMMINCMFFREKLEGIGENICTSSLDACEPVDCPHKTPHCTTQELSGEGEKS